MIMAYLTLPTVVSAAPTATVLYSFKGLPDGQFPNGQVVFDAQGNLYGVTQIGGSKCGNSAGSCGTVFELSPPPKGQTAWTEQVIWRFNGSVDGYPGTDGSIAIDAQGSLYVTCGVGGASNWGVIDKLTPPSSGKTLWTETILWTFPGGNAGFFPAGPVILDSSGNVYGTARSNIYRLNPPISGSAQWTETTLYTWASPKVMPAGRMVIGGGGALYGVSSGGGGTNDGFLYKLSPPAAGAKKWSFANLTTFIYKSGGSEGGPYYAPLLSSNGTFYGTTDELHQVGCPQDCIDYRGTAWSATPPAAGGTKWVQKTIVKQFEGANGSIPGGELLQDSSGDLFGSMMEYGQFGAGVVFKLSPETGTSLWNETVLYAFGAAAGDGSGPEQLVADAHGQLYVGTFRGGANNLGAVVEISGSGFQP